MTDEQVANLAKIIADAKQAKPAQPTQPPDRLMQIVMVVLGGLVLAVVVSKWEQSSSTPTSMAVLSQQVTQIDAKVEKLNLALEEKTKDRIYRTEYDEDFRDLRSRINEAEDMTVDQARAVSRLVDRVDRNERDLADLRGSKP